MIDAEAMSELTVRDLLATHEAVLEALRGRGVMRTDDAPAQQYARWLAHEAFGGVMAPEGAHHDLLTPDGRRLLVRSVVVRGARDDRQLAPFRGVDFDELLVILFDASYEVIRASVLTKEHVMRLARWKPQLNGRILTARDAVLALGTDVRRRLPSNRASGGPVVRAVAD
jgi:hypothetical protein